MSAPLCEHGREPGMCERCTSPLVATLEIRLDGEGFWIYGTSPYTDLEALGAIVGPQPSIEGVLHAAGSELTDRLLRGALGIDKHALRTLVRQFLRPHIGDGGTAIGWLTEGFCPRCGVEVPESGYCMGCDDT